MAYMSILRKSNINLQLLSIFVKIWYNLVGNKIALILCNNCFIIGGYIFMEKSYFDGGLSQLIGWKLLGSLITAFTFGICFPWAICMIYNWEAKHTVINGGRLKFDGKAIQLFGNWIKWALLTIITFGIYGFWVNIKLKKWKVMHTTFETPQNI